VADPRALRHELWSAVERHPTQLTPEAEQRLRELVDGAATRLASEPERTDEAVANLQRFLDYAAEQGSDSEAEGDVGILALGVEISPADIEAGLRDLCPIFPICR
jgi:hypothetical protein